MQAKGIVWLGTRTPQAAAMRAFIRDGLGLEPAGEQPGVAIFRCLNGDTFEIFEPDEPTHGFMQAPVAGFRVDDIARARAELEARGVLFIGPIHQGEDGGAWSHFFAPDGHIYELTT